MKLRRLESESHHVHTAVQRVPEYVGSYGEAVTMGGRVVIVAERVDPFFGTHGVGFY